MLTRVSERAGNPVGERGHQGIDPLRVAGAGDEQDPRRTEPLDLGGEPDARCASAEDDPCSPRR
ncbi:MAG: hypothetical protein M3O29_05670 [Actinomycetota bacterium]|nr:hypothetical protein [Actinomycetota bacterium]